jgi:hypothetical protein
MQRSIPRPPALPSRPRRPIARRRPIGTGSRPKPPAPPRVGWCTDQYGIRRPCALHGAEFGAADNAVLIWGLIPMGIAVAAGLWMTLRG